MTLLELIIACTIAKHSIVYKREELLRYELRQMRDAIDRYKDLADANKIRVEVGSEGYPPDLETLVSGVDVQGKKVRFLRRIPIDPMTGKPDWGMRSMQDDKDSQVWGGQNVFDVYTKSTGMALDGTKYADW